MADMIVRGWYDNTPSNMPPGREWGGTLRRYRDILFPTAAANGDVQTKGPRLKKGTYVVGGRCRWAGASGGDSSGVFTGKNSVNPTITIGDSTTCNRFKLVQSLTYASCEAMERFDATTLPYFCTCDMDVLVTIANGSGMTCTTSAATSTNASLTPDGFALPFTTTPAPGTPIDPQFYPKPWIYLEVDVIEP